MDCGMNLILTSNIDFFQITTINDLIHDDTNYVDLASKIGEYYDDEYFDCDNGDKVDQDGEYDDHDEDCDHDLDDDVIGGSQLPMLYMSMLHSRIYLHVLLLIYNYDIFIIMNFIFIYGDCTTYFL